VRDHCRALLAVAERGRAGESYVIGAATERTTLAMVHAVCDALERLRPRAEGRYADLARFVRDRPGHDRRYAIDAHKIRAELGWSPETTFVAGLEETVGWYLDHPGWCQRARQRSR
jgi:dTDP-glucose 4,6-dehydratase